MYYRPKLANGKVVPLSFSLSVVRRFNHIYWPLEDGISRWLVWLDRIAWIVGLIIFLIHDDAEMRYIYESVQDWDEMLTGVPTYLVLVEIQLRGFFISWSKEHFGHLVKRFYTQIYVDQTDEAKSFQHIQRQLWPTAVCCFLYYGAILSFFAVPILNVVNHRKDTLYKMSFPYDHTRNYIFIPLTISSMYVGCIVVTIVFGEINMISEIMLHLNERYILLRRDFHLHTERLIKRADARHIVNDFKRELLQVIQRNEQLNDFADELQRVYSYRIFVLFAFSTALICTLGFIAYTNPAQSYGYVMWMCAKLLEMLVVGEAGSALVATTDEVSTMYYQSGWEEVILRSGNSRDNVRLMKLVILAIELNQKPFALMGLNFFSVSLSAVVKIIQGAGSYFTCLISFR